MYKAHMRRCAARHRLWTFVHAAQPHYASFLASPLSKAHVFVMVLAQASKVLQWQGRFTLAGSLPSNSKLSFHMDESR